MALSNLLEGGCMIPNFFRNFMLEFGIFSEREGGGGVGIIWLNTFLLVS